VVICAKTAEPIEMLFGLWARMGRRNHVLDGGPQVLRDFAMATNFVAKIAIKWLCVNDGTYAIGYAGIAGGLSGRPTECRYCPYLHLRDVAMATIFGFLYMGCTLAPPGEYD